MEELQVAAVSAAGRRLGSCPLASEALQTIHSMLGAARARGRATSGCHMQFAASETFRSDDTTITAVGPVCAFIRSLLLNALIFGVLAGLLLDTPHEGGKRFLEVNSKDH